MRSRKRKVPAQEAPESAFDRAALLAKISISPANRNGTAAFLYADGQPRDLDDFTRRFDAVKAELAALVDKDKLGIENMLASQALLLDAMFTDFATIAFRNKGQHVEAAEVFARLALKAQANSRATLEALMKAKRGGEQIVKHIHVDNRGGQAVITDRIETGSPGGHIQEDDGQPHANIADPRLAALSGQDAIRQALPGRCDEERPMSHARRPVDGRTEGEPERLETWRAVRRD